MFLVVVSFFLFCSQSRMTSFVCNSSVTYHHTLTVLTSTSVFQNRLFHRLFLSAGYTRGEVRKEHMATDKKYLPHSVLPNNAKIYDASRSRTCQPLDLLLTLSLPCFCQLRCYRSVTSVSDAKLRPLYISSNFQLNYFHIQ